MSDKYEFSLQEAGRIKEICKACEHYGGGYSYCLRYKTDSTVFKYNLCEELRKREKINYD